MTSDAVSSLSTSSALENWETIVDSIRANESKAPLPDHYDPAEFIPLLSPSGEAHGSPVLTDEMARALLQNVKEKVMKSTKDTNGTTEDADEDCGDLWEEEANKLFQPQLTLLESLHAMPSVPHFSRLAVDVSNSPLGNSVLALSSTFHTTSAESKSPSSVGSSSEALESILPPEGPNYLTTYEGSTSALGDGAHGDSTTTPSPARRHRRRLEQDRATLSSSSGQKKKVQEHRSPLPPMRLGSTSRLTAGFVNPAFYAAIHLKPNFIPIILAPSTVTAPIQLVNVKRFLEEGRYVDPSSYYIDQETGAASIRRAKPERVIVSSALFKRNLSTKVSFREFCILDDPLQVENWDHVCAAIVTGKSYQFETWFPEEHRSICQPSYLFQRVAGFLPYFEEDPIPVGVQQWKVMPLLLTKRMVKEQQHIFAAARFWETLFQLLDLCPLFNKYTQE